ncbi:MAG: CvpA family protein, partial [Phycisphaeraceae bacterium]
MLILLNLVVVILLLVCIAMWATYGFFSAFIQLIIVIGAGVLAFALWEPVSHALLGRMPAYAHGVGLLAPFAILLIVLRVVFDKLCRANVHVPRLADQIGGAACGLGIGILAFGLVFNAVNFLPLQRDLMGWEPYKIRGNDVTANDTGHLWLNIHAWSGGFFTMLSGGSMHPTGGTPLVEARPALAKRALLYRMPPDSNQMRSAHPGSVSVTGLLAVPATEDAVRALALRSTLFAFLKPSYQVPSDIALGEDGLGLVRGLFNELDRRFEDSATHGKPSDMIDIDAIMKVSRTPQFTFPAATSRDNIEPFIDQVAEQIADDMVNRLRPVLGPGKMLYAVDTQWNNKFPGTFNTDGKLRVAISSVELQAKTNDGFEMIAPVGYSIEYSQNTGGRIFTEIISDQVDVDLRDSAYSRYTELSMGWFFVVPDGQTPERFFVRELRFDLDQLEDVAGQDSVVNQNIGAFARAMG